MGIYTNPKSNTMSIVKSVYSNMKNIQYCQFTTLKDHDWVEKNKKGSCHDQVMYELEELKKYGLSPNAKFFIQVDDKGQGYETHSFVYLRINGKYIWFENAWKDYAGIHIYDSYSEMKKDIERKINCKQNIHIVWGKFNTSKLQPGDSLQSVVDKCLN